MVYSIAVPHVSENARQRVSPLVSGVRAGLSGLRRVRVVSVPPVPLELAKRRASRTVWVTDMWAQRASGPHVSDTPIAPAVKSGECGIDILERR